jgi:hypothetical protein
MPGILKTLSPRQGLLGARLHGRILSAYEPHPCALDTGDLQGGGSAGEDMESSLPIPAGMAVT